MNELLTQIWNYEAIAAHLASGNLEAAAEVTTSALTQARAEMEEFEEWFEREAAAEEAWRNHGSQLLKDLNAEDLPF